MKPYINEPVGGKSVLIIDLVDEHGIVTHPQATYEVNTTYNLLGFGGVLQSVGATQLTSIGTTSIDPEGLAPGLPHSFPTWIGGKDGVGLLISEVEHLAIETLFGIAATKIKIDETETDEVVVFPAFSAGTSMRMVWQRPADFPRLFVITLASHIDGYTSYIFAWKDATLWRLPLPNIYDHSALCIGRASENELDSRSSLTDRHAITMNALLRNAWNTDLIDGDKAIKCKNLFRWKTDGTQLEAQAPWDRLLTRIASPWASNLLLQIP